MLRAQKYLGPEVDIWSLGIILYTLLTGTLPFDDDDESIMREKIIMGRFENPDWLSPDARDLIDNILQFDPSKRLTIPQILAHAWFKNPPPTPCVTSPTPLTPSTPDANAVQIPAPTISQAQSLPSPSASEGSFQTASSELPKSALSDEQKDDNERTVRGNPPMDDSLHGPSAWRRSPKRRATAPPVLKDEEEDPPLLSRDPSPSAQRSTQPAPPTTFPTRTPARTKRRSVSSILSLPSGEGQLPKIFPSQDYVTLLSTPAPLLFSTPLERTLLNTLNNTGFDVGQMVHSVISDACDSAGALWWMLKRKAEKKALEAALNGGIVNVSVGTEAETEIETDLETILSPTVLPLPAMQSTHKDTAKDSDAFTQSISAPQLSFVPATPTAPDRSKGRRSASPPATPPRSKSPRSLLSPTPTSSDTQPQGLSKSTPSTPSGSLRDKDRDSTSTSSKGKGSKPRSGSVSIMQRVTTGLESAGLMRKKSAEAVREDKDKKDKEDKEDKGKRASSSTDSKNGHHPTGHARLTKSPPMRPVKDTPLPSTPEHQEVTTNSNLPSASPWVMPVARSSTFSVAPTPANSPGDASPISNGDASHKMNGARNRTSILSTFRTWFIEDRKGKRKAVPSPPPQGNSQQTPSSPSLNRTRSGTKRRGGVGGFGAQRPRAKRASISSRRSSSVNSRRSSVASMQVPTLETTHAMESVSRQRSDPSHRSFTPNSEVERTGDYPSRPSSIRSYSMQQTRHGHRKSPSASSIGSTARLARAASPLQKYHRRAGSGSSTRVVRQARPNQPVAPRTSHGRSNSTASSVHSLHSSRPGSFYDASEGEGQGTHSPLPTKNSYVSLDETPRRGAYSTVLVAHKRQTPFNGPSTSSPSISRMSWKKTWGTEPPGWKSRSTQYPVEVLAIFPANDQATSIRDVFSNRQSLNLGDDFDSDWVDEEEESPTFAGGLGQTWTSASTMKGSYDAPMTLSLPPRGNSRNSKNASRTNGGLTPRNTTQRNGGRTKAGHSPVTNNTPLPGSDGVFCDPVEFTESRVSRRQLPSGRSGPAFKQPIQEEDEDEE